MSINWSQYNRETLRSAAIQSFREGGGSRPDVLLIEIDGQYAVLKDHNATDRLFALLIGPLLTWRECKALKKLHAIDGIPNLLSQPDARSFLMTYHPSEQVTKTKQSDPDWPNFFPKLETLIRTMHSHGVAHNDLRNPTNILITNDGQPVFVDLVACFCQGHRLNAINQWMFGKFCQVDYSAVTKLKTRVAPELIKDSDIQTEEIAGTLGMTLRKLGQWVRRLSRVLFTK